jgi:hypothetical protein
MLLLLSLCALGCKTDPNQVLIERDLRLQEDRIYELESMLEECCGAREATIRENQALKKELAGGDRGAGPDYRSPASTSPGDSQPDRRPRRDKTPKLEPPTIELPEPSSTPPADLPGATPPEVPGGKQSALIGSGPPTQIVINKRLTGGLNRGAEPGDEGIMVAFEPRDAQGRLVKVPGAVSVVVLDPSLEGEAGRIARWDFELDEVPAHFRNTAFGRGLQFELPWPTDPPKNRDLRLFVRFITPEGRKITAETPITVRTANDLPRIERKTKDRSTAGKADRPDRAATESRIKSPRVALSAPRDIEPADQQDAATADEEATIADQRGAPREPDDRDRQESDSAEREPADGAPAEGATIEQQGYRERIESDNRDEPVSRQPTRRSARPRTAPAPRPEWKPFR